MKSRTLTWITGMTLFDSLATSTPRIGHLRQSLRWLCRCRDTLTEQPNGGTARLIAMEEPFIGGQVKGEIHTSN
jgi:hypothetical protein